MVAMWQNQSLSLAVGVAAALMAGARLVRVRASVLASPAMRRRAHEQVVRLITVVAGH